MRWRTSTSSAILTARRAKWNPGAGPVAAPGPTNRLQPARLTQPSLVDTAVWTWVRDRRFPALADWFNREVRSGRVLVCDLIVLELIRLAPNAERAHELATRLAAFEALPMPQSIWLRGREVQLAMATNGDHRRVPPADLLIAATAELAGVQLVHYDRDYERIARATAQPHVWFVPDGALVDKT
jgi:predicted nucleic acid-binding protein